MSLAEQLQPWVDAFQCRCSILGMFKGCLVLPGDILASTTWNTMSSQGERYCSCSPKLRLRVQGFCKGHQGKWLDWLPRQNGTCLFWLNHSRVCLQTSDSPTFYGGFSRCWTKTCRGIGSKGFFLAKIDDLTRCWASFPQCQDQLISQLYIIVLWEDWTFAVSSFIRHWPYFYLASMIVFPSVPWRSCLGFLAPKWRRCISSQSPQHVSKRWQVSSLGRCCSTFGIISEGTLSHSGYRKIKIAGFNWLVHRVVKLSFHGPPELDELWQVHHRDGNRANNVLQNLEYVTPSQNQLHAVACASTSARQYGQVQAKQVLWRAVGSEEWLRSPSIQVLANQLDICRHTISSSCRRSLPTKGFEFKFQDMDSDQVEVTMAGEEWRPMLHPSSGAQVPGRLISSFGRVRWEGARERVSQGSLCSSGYFKTTLYGKKVSVHRLVALAFLGPPADRFQTQVNHKDLDKSNNAVSNLEWVTAAENRAHFHANASMKRVAGVRPVWSRAYKSTDCWSWHPSIASAAATLGVFPGGISNCILNKTSQYRGFEFRLAESPAMKSLPGEEWRDVDLATLLRDKAILRETYAWCRFFRCRINHGKQKNIMLSLPCHLKSHLHPRSSWHVFLDGTWWLLAIHQPEVCSRNDRRMGPGPGSEM